MPEEVKDEEYSVAQRYRISAVYQILAQALPTEGRDYAVRFAFPNGPSGESVSVRFEPYTEIGRIWCDYCRKVLSAKGTK